MSLNFIFYGSLLWIFAAVSLNFDFGMKVNWVEITVELTMTIKVEEISKKVRSSTMQFKESETFQSSGSLAISSSYSWYILQELLA